MRKNLVWILATSLAMTGLMGCSDSDNDSDAACDEGVKTCQGNTLMVCSDGDWNVEEACSGATPKCDATALKCVADSSQTAKCEVAKCTKPANASEMACESDKCVVAKCADGYKVNTAKDACEQENVTSTCVAAECTKPANASEMACESDKCVVAKCVDGYKVNTAKDACEQETVTQTCDASACTKPEHASQMGCSEDDVCIVLACEGEYDVNNDQSACIDREQPPIVILDGACAMYDGTETAIIADGEMGCVDATHLAKCENGVVSTEQTDCAANGSVKVCRGNTANGVTTYGCYKEDAQNKICTIDDYETTCAEKINGAQSITGCNAAGYCQFTCPSGTVKTKTGCDKNAKCSTVSVTLEGDNIVASGVATRDAQLTGASLYCSNDLNNATSAWNSISMNYDNVQVKDDSNYTLSVSTTADAMKLENGKYYCAIFVKSAAGYWACPAGEVAADAISSVVDVTKMTDAQTIAIDYVNQCGNGQPDEGEECDGSVGDKTCQAYLNDDKATGNVKCTACKFDYSDCKASSPDKKELGELYMTFKPVISCSEFKNQSDIVSCAGVNTSGAAIDDTNQDTKLKQATLSYDNNVVVNVLANAGFANDQITLYETYDNTKTAQYIELTQLPENYIVYVYGKGSKVDVDYSLIITDGTYSEEYTCKGQDVCEHQFDMRAGKTSVKVGMKVQAKYFINKIEVYAPKK